MSVGVAVSANSPLRVTLHDLEPSTRYKVGIAASTIVGKGEYVTTETYTSPSRGRSFAWSFREIVRL